MIRLPEIKTADSVRMGIPSVTGPSAFRTRGPEYDGATLLYSLTLALPY